MKAPALALLLASCASEPAGAPDPCSFVPTVAQGVYGVITYGDDTVGAMPAANFNVVARPSSSETAPGTVTDRNGFYELELPADHYRLCSTSGGSDECFALDLAPDEVRRIEGVPNGLVGWHWAEATCPGQ